LTQLRGTQDFLEAGGLGVDVAAACPPQRGGDLGAGQPVRPVRVRGPAQQFQRIRGGEVVEGLQGGGEELPQRAATSFTASAWVLSPATGR
jgi:hypothetical protein